MYKKDETIAVAIIDMLEDNDDEVSMNAVTALGELSIGDFDFYSKFGNKLIKMEKLILELLNHENLKIRSRVALDVSMFPEDENSRFKVLEKAKPLLFKLLKEDDLKIQRNAGFSLSVLSSMVYEEKRDYAQYLEILNALTKNFYVLAYLKERTKFLKIDLPILEEILNSANEDFRQEANSLIKIVEKEIDPEFINEIEKKEEKKHEDVDNLLDIMKLIYDPAPEKDIEALKLINEALEGTLSISDSVFAHYQKGAILRWQNLLKEAKKEIELALRIDPKFGDNELLFHLAWTELANIYKDMGKITKCIETMQEMIKILPTYFNLENIKRTLAVSHLDLALIFMRNTKVKNPDDNFLFNIQKAINSDSDFPDTYYYLGQYYIEKKLYHRVKENFERYLELTPYETSFNKAKIEDVKNNLAILNEIFE